MAAKRIDRVEHIPRCPESVLRFHNLADSPVMIAAGTRWLAMIPTRGVPR